MALSIFMSQRHSLLQGEATVEAQGRHDFNQVIELTITNNDSQQPHVPPDVVH